MNLGAGTFVIWGKAWFANVGAAATVACTLNTTGELDENQMLVNASGVVSTSFIGVATLASTTSVSVSCNTSSGLATVTASDLKLLAVKVETLTGL